jgi:glycogen operon protein
MAASTAFALIWRRRSRSPSGFDRDAPFLSAILQDPVLRDLSASPNPGTWARRLSARRLSRAFAEWNDRYRDGARRFWRGTRGVAELATRRRLAGRVARRPSRSVNFIGA